MQKPLNPPFSPRKCCIDVIFGLWKKCSHTQVSRHEPRALRAAERGERVRLEQPGHLLDRASAGQPGRVVLPPRALEGHERRRPHRRAHVPRPADRHHRYRDGARAHETLGELPRELHSKITLLVAVAQCSPNLVLPSLQASSFPSSCGSSTRRETPSLERGRRTSSKTTPRTPSGERRVSRPGMQTQTRTQVCPDSKQNFLHLI